MRKLMISLLLLAAASFAESPELVRVRGLYQRTQYEEALGLLERTSTKGATEYLLIGQCQYMLGEFRRATDAFEKAVKLAPGDAESYLWLGRAYGRRAETSSFLTAPGHASRARQNFENAVELNPRHMEAISDLFEYYMEAPGILGGGLDKAARLAEKMKGLDPPEYHFALAQVAEKRKEFQTAENQLRRAAELAPRQVGRVIDLAKFLAKQGRYEESEAAFRQAETVAPGDPKLLFARASTYIRTKRNLGKARELLEQFLHSPLTPEDPPREEAERLLKQAAG